MVIAGAKQARDRGWSVVGIPDRSAFQKFLMFRKILRADQNYREDEYQRDGGGAAPPFYKLLFHSLFKVEFDIDQFVLGEHRER